MHKFSILAEILRDEKGASAAEYAMLLVIIGVAIVAGGFALSGAIGSAMSATATCLDAGTSGSCR